MSGGGGFRGRGFVPQGHCRQGSDGSGGPKPCLGRPGSRQSNTGYPRSDGPGCGPRPSGRGGRSRRNPRNGGSNFRGGAGSASSPRPNFNLTRHPPRHQSRPPDNWPPRGGGVGAPPRPMFNPWQGGRPMRFNTPPPFFRGRGQNAFPPFRYPPPPIGTNYPPPPFTEFPPTVDPKPQVPHLGSEEERQQKITEAADKLKRTLSSVAKEQYSQRTYNENDDETIVRADDLVPDHESRITSRGIPELKHDPPELHLTVGDLRDIGRVDLDHTARTTKVDVASTSDDQDVVILAHNPVQEKAAADMIEIDTWADDKSDDSDMERTMQEPVSYTTEVMSSPRCLEDPVVYSCNDTINKETTDELQIGGESAIANKTENSIQTQSDQQDETSKSHTPNVEADTSVIEKRTQEKMVIDQCQDDSNIGTEEMRVLFETTATAVDSTNSSTIRDKIPLSRSIENLRSERDVTPLNKTDKTLEIVTIRETETQPNNSDRLNINMTIKTGKKKDRNEHSQIETTNEISVDTRDPTTNKDIRGIRNELSDQNVNARIDEMEHAMEVLDKSQDEAPSKSGAESGSVAIDEKLKETRDKINSESQSVSPMAMQRGKTIFQPHVEIEKEALKNNTSRESSSDKQDETRSKLTDDNNFCENKIPKDQDVAISESKDNASLNRQSDNEITDGGAATKRMQKTREKCKQLDSSRQIENSEKSDCSEYKKSTDAQSAKSEDRGKAERTASGDVMKKKQQDGKFDNCRVEYLSTCPGKNSDDHRNSKSNLLIDEKNPERRKLVKQIPKGSLTSKERRTVPGGATTRSASTDFYSNESSTITDSPVFFDPRAPPPSVRAYDHPPPSILTGQEEQPQLPPAFDPRLSTLDRRVLMSSALPINQDFTMTPSYPSCPMTNLVPNVPPLNYVSPAAIMGAPIESTSNIRPMCINDPYTPIMPLPSVPVTAPIVLPMQPPLPTEPPPPPPPPGKSSLDMEDELEDMQEAMEFAKQLMNMTESSTGDVRMNDREDSEDSDFFHMPTFPDLPPIELPPLPPVEPDKNTRRDCPVSSSKECKKTNKKYEPATYGPLPKSEAQSVVTDAIVEIPGISDEQLRPKVVFNLSSKTKVIVKQEDWRQQHLDDLIEVSTTGFTTKSATNADVPKNRKNNKSSSECVTLPVASAKKDKLGVNGQEEKKKPVEKGSRYNGKVEQTSPISFSNKKTEEAKLQPSTLSPSTLGKSTNLDKESLGHSISVIADKNSICRRKASRESSLKKPGDLQTPESTWKTRVIGRFLKMSKNDICNMLNNTSLRKFDIAMKHLVKERRSLGTRNNEEERGKDVDVSYDTEEFMDQLSAMLDSSATVDVCNIPTQFIHHLSEVLQLDTLPEFEAALAGSDPGAGVSNVASRTTPPIVESRHTTREPMPSADSHEIDEREQLKRGREKSINTSVVGTAATATTVTCAATTTSIATPTATTQRTPNSRTREELVESSQCNVVCVENVVEQDAGNRVVIGPRSRRRRLRAVRLAQQEASSTMKNGTVVRPMEENSLNMADLDDIFTAGIARAKKKHTCVKTMMKSEKKEDHQLHVIERRVMPVVKDPNVDRVERAAVELDEIFTAGIAKAKLASKNAAAAAAKAAEANDGDDDDEEQGGHSWNYNEHKANRENQRTRSKLTTGATSKSDKWCRRKGHGNPDAFRNLTKEEWEAKFSESSYATYQREYRALAAMRARRTNRSPANPKNDLPTTESNEVTSVKSRLGDPVQPAGAYEAWSGSDESTRLRNVNDPSNNYDQHSDSSTSTSTSSDSTGQDEETDGSVTKLLKVIKQREKIAKKRSINEEIRDEVTAEIERKRREKEKLRKRHKTRTKKSSHRRKRDKKDKSRERKRHERKRKKRKIRHSGENSRELSDNADADEDTSSTSRGQQSHSLLTEEEIKKEAVIVIKDEPDAVSMVSSSKRSAKNSMLAGGNDDSRPPSTASSSSIPSITVTSTTTLVTGTHQLKTKAQLKQMPDIVTKFQPGTETSKGIAKAQPVVAPENPKENSIFKADYLTSPDVLMFNNELDNNSPHMTRPMPSAWTVPVQPGSTTGDDPSSTSKPSSKKLDIETYKERTRQRLHIENAKRRRIADNPSTLTHDLLNIPLTRKKLSETTGAIVQESREDVMSTSHTESSNTTTTVDTTITSTTTIDLTGSTPQLGIAALPARASVFQKESSQQVLPAKTPRKKIVRKVSAAASAAAAAAAAATAAAVAATSTSAGGTTTIVEKSTAIGSSAGAGKFAHIKSEGQKELKLREKLRKGHSRPSIESLITDIPAIEPMRLNRRKSLTGSTSIKESAVSSTKSNIDVALSSKNVNTSTDVSKTVDTSENLDTPTSSDTSTKLIATKSFHNKLKANAVKSLHTSTKTDAAKSLHTSTKNDAGKSLHTLKKNDAVKRLHTSTKIGAATSLNTSKNVAVLESLNTPTKDNVAKNLDNSMNVSVSESLDISAKNDVSRHLDASTNVEVSQTLDTSISVDVQKSLDNTMDAEITKPLDISINAHPSKSLDLDVSKGLKILTNEDVSKRLNTSMNVDISQSLDTSKNVNVLKNLDAPKDVDVSTNLDISTTVQESQSLNSFTDLDATKNLIVSRNADLSKNLDTSTKTEVPKTLDNSTKVDVPKTLATSIKVDVPRALATSTKVDVQKTLDNSIKVDVSKSLDTSTKVDVSKSLGTLTKVDVSKSLDRTKVDVPKSLNRTKVDVQNTLDTSAKVNVPETFNVSTKMNVSKTLNTMTDEIVSRSLDMSPSVEDVSTSLDKSENANVSKTLHMFTDVPRSLETAENVDILKSLESSTKEDTSETLNISMNGDESQIVDIPFKSNVLKSSDILTNVDLSQSLDSSNNVDVSKSLETSIALEISEGLDPPTSLHVTKNMEVPENRLVSCILPTTIPQERLPVMKEKPTTTEALGKQRELQTLDISIEELPGWSLEAAVATCSKPDTVDYSSESPPFKGFIEQPILRRDRVLTEAKINAMETEALETVPLEFVVDSVISVREDADIADLTRTDVVETLDVPISYGDVAFTENRDVIETSLPDPLGHTLFSVANEIDDVPVSVTEGSVPNDATSDENLELQQSSAIVPPLIPTSAATNFLVENAEKQDIESSPLLDTKSRCNETNDIYTTDSTPKDTIGEPSHNKNTTNPIDDTKETTLSEHFVNKIVTESTSLKAELPVIKVDALQCSTDVANSTRDTCEMDIPQRRLEEFTVSRDDVEARELGNNVTVSDETSSKEFVSSTLETSVVNIEKPHTTDISSSKEIDEPTQGTSVAMSSVTIDEHSREVEATSKDLHQSKSSMKEHGHSKSKKKSSRLHKHGSKTSSKTQLTEKMIEEAIATNVVKLVSKSSSKETVMARMIEIDVEIHKLMNEKMTLYKMLESNDFPTRHTTEIGTTSKTPDEAKTLETKEETSASEIVPPAVLTSRFMRNFTTPTRQQEDTTRKVEAKRVNSENESKMKKRKKSPQRESGKNHSREQDMSGVRHDRKNSESKSQSRRTPSEEPSRHESTLTNLREKSTSSTDLDDAEDRRRRRPTKSPNRHSSKRQNEHSSREDLHEALRDSADHTIKPTKHDRTKKNSKSPGETKRNEESPKKSKMQEEKANNNVRLSARHKTIQSGVIYSDESTRDSVNLEVVQSDEARGKKDNSGSSTGLALLEESFKREMAEQRRIKNVSKRKNKHREFGRTLVVPSLLTADEAQTGLANLINRKVARKRELAGSTEAKNGSSGNPVKVWKHVTSVIDAVAKNCVEQLYNADDTDQSSVEATTPDEMLVEEHENNKKEGGEKEDSIQQRKEEPHKITIEPEQNESTRGDCYKSITSSVTTAESREFIESGETNEPSNLNESENRVASSILTETTSSGNLEKTPDFDIVSKRRMNKLDNIIIFEDKKIEKSVNEDSFTTKNSNKNELVEEGSTKYDESEATRDIDAAKEKREIDESKKKREIDESKGKHAIDEIGKSIDVHRSTKSRSPSPEHAQGEIDELVEEFEIQKEDANKDLSGKTGVELTQEKSDDIIEKEGSEKLEFVSSSKETNEKVLHSRNRRSHSAKKRGKFHRETSSSTSDRKSHEDDKSNPLQLESNDHGHHEEKSPGRPRSANKRKPREKGGPPSRRSSRQSEDSGKPSRGKRRNEDRSNSRGLSPDDGEPLRKRTHYQSRRSSSPNISATSMDDHSRRRGRKLKRRLELSHEEMINCRVELVDCKHTYLSPTMHPKILRKLGISKINPYVKPTCGSENLGHPKVTRIETPSPSILNKIAIIECPIENTAEEPEPEISAISNVPECLDISSPGVTIERSSSPCVIDNPKENVDDDDEDDEDDEATIHIVKVVDESLPQTSIGDQDEETDNIEVVQETLEPADNAKTPTEVIAVEEDEPMDVDDPMEEYEIIDDIDDVTDVGSDRANVSDEVQICEEKESGTSTEKTSQPERLPVTEDDDDVATQPRRTRYTVHKGPILDIKVLDDSFLAASEDGAIYRYSQTSNGILNIYKGHEAAVTCIHVLEMPGKRWNLYSGSLDGTFRCYDITTGAQDRLPANVGSPVQCMDEAWGTIYVGTKSGHISRYNIKSGSVKGDRLEFSDKSVLALKTCTEGPRRVLIVASRNQPITIRDALTGLFLRTVCGYKNHTVYSLLREGNLVYCGTSNTSIPVYNFTNGEQVTQYHAGVGIVCMRLYRQILFAGCYDGNIYVFDTEESKLVCSIPGPGNMLLSMEVVDDEIIAGSKNRQLHSWRMPREVRALLAKRT